MNRTHIRTWQRGRFRLDICDTGRRDWRGQSKLAYEFRDSDRLVFQGDDFAGSPLHADDSHQTVAALLSFLSLRPGDTDREYFDSYTPEQLEWAQANGEELSLLATELEKRARLGFMPCTVETRVHTSRPAGRPPVRTRSTAARSFAVELGTQWNASLPPCQRPA